MIFPDAPRVLYERNTLDTVICQLRFPQILRVDAEEPAEFQERIRGQYPVLNTRGPIDLSAALPPEIAKLVGENLPIQFRQGRIYDFVSADEKWKATLARDFLALTASRSYVRWEDFKQRLMPVLEAVVQIYQPAFFNRIGLRYQNLIRRSVFNLQGVSWAELIQPHIAAELASSVPENAIEGITTAVRFTFEGGAKVQVQHGLGQAEGSGEIGYVIDSDFFTEERTEVLHAIDRLENFNREARRLFHWCIKPRLHEAMEPRPL